MFSIIIQLVTVIKHIFKSKIEIKRLELNLNQRTKGSKRTKGEKGEEEEVSQEEEGKLSLALNQHLIAIVSSSRSLLSLPLSFNASFFFLLHCPLGFQGSFSHPKPVNCTQQLTSFIANFAKQNSEHVARRQGDGGSCRKSNPAMGLGDLGGCAHVAVTQPRACAGTRLSSMRKRAHCSKWLDRCMGGASARKGRRNSERSGSKNAKVLLLLLDPFSGGETKFPRSIWLAAVD